jgi:exodeoxyribonuclease V
VLTLPYESSSHKGRGSPSAPSQRGSAMGNVHLDPAQLEVVSAITNGVKQGKRRQVLAGYAGTGKTTCIRSLSTDLEGFAVCAPTGKAAAVLRRKEISASTIHSLIYRPVKACERSGSPCRPTDGQPCDCRIVGWERRGFLGIEGFIVDESSMVSQEIHGDIMAFGLPAIFVGDHGQLPPVEAKRTGFSVMSSPDYRLEVIHRHAGEIPRFAEHLRKGHPSVDFEPRSDAVILMHGDIDDEIVLAADQVIVAKNKTRVEVNAYIRRKLGRQARIERGERVICLRNHREDDLQNGMQGTVVSVAGNRIDLDSEDGPREGIEVDPDQFGREKAPEFGARNWLHPFDYAYAITCHKAQGGEWPSVLVTEERCGAWDHSRWAYTAATRAQEKLWWHADRPIRRRAARPPSPFTATATNSAEIGGAQ